VAVVVHLVLEHIRVTEAGLVDRAPLQIVKVPVQAVPVQVDIVALVLTDILVIADITEFTRVIAVAVVAVVAALKDIQEIMATTPPVGEAELVYMAKDVMVPEHLLIGTEMLEDMVAEVQAAVVVLVVVKVEMHIVVHIPATPHYIMPGIMEILVVKQLHPTVVHTELQDNLDTPVQQLVQEVVAEVEP
jgi:hypothetical protein